MRMRFSIQEVLCIASCALFIAGQPVVGAIFLSLGVSAIRRRGNLKFHFWVPKGKISNTFSTFLIIFGGCAKNDKKLIFDRF